MRAALSLVVGLPAILVLAAGAASDSTPAGWTTLRVPGAWEEVSDGRFANYDGFAWYRCFFQVPESWKARDLALILQQIDDADETFFNGHQVGATGSMPPRFKSASAAERRYPVPAKHVRFGDYNLLAVRVYDGGGRGGLRGPLFLLQAGKEAIRLTGVWQFRTGDDPAWAQWPATPDSAEGRKAVGEYRAAARPPVGSRGVEEFLKVYEKPPRLVENIEGAKGLEEAMRRLHAPLAGTDPLSPAESLKRFKVPDDLAIDLVAAEPVVRQPVYITFDERGRLWTVQYNQYPFPAGLKVVSYDQYIRAQFDRVPPPPPNHVRGADKITIHEDTHGNGTLDQVKVFLEGLNITTAVLPGRGGVWVLNPPYLLFYPDKDRKDVAAAKPEVHLSGFGLEDTHAVANSLTWGPDGWIYGGHGSTCTARVKVEITGSPHTTDFLGQAIWRYHPETHRFEVFAEGGGNTFGVEFDDQGRVYSGTNGDRRGVYFVQGGYYLKGWGKHGPLTNPYAFGYFEFMPATANTQRFTHTFLVYGGATLPERFNGRMIAPNPFQRRVQVARLEPFGSSFKPVEEGFLVTTSDGWFRPIDIKTGPDGAVYFTDFYENRISHLDPRDTWDRSTGRIYRVRPKDYKPVAPFDLSRLSSHELVGLLGHKNRWYRQTALRLLGDRKDRSVVPELRRGLEENTGQLALESLWALNLCGGFSEEFALRALHHADPFVRMWTVRLLGDPKGVSPSVAIKLAELAANEPHAQVRSQLASSAKRLPGPEGLLLTRELLKRDEDLNDPHIPLLLWWALEPKVEPDREAVLALFREAGFWKLPLVDRIIVERLVQRYVMAGGKENLQTCARLLRLVPGPDQAERVLAGLEKGFGGRTITDLPDELKGAIAKAWSGGVSKSRIALGLRIGHREAVDKALALVADEKADAAKRLEYVHIFGEVNQRACVPVLLKVSRQSPSAALRQEALTALQRYDDPQVGARVLEWVNEHPQEQEVIRSAAYTLLVSRPAWALQLLQAVDAGRVNPRTLSLDLVRKLKLHQDRQIARLVEKHWGQVRANTPAEKQQEILRLASVIRAGQGNAGDGKLVFTNTCAKCHKLFGEGATVGPDLTGYERDNLLYWLENVVDPSASIREEYTNFIVQTSDGRILTGLVAEQDKRTVTLKGPEGQVVRIDRDKIDEMKASPLSIMPEDQLRTLADQQVRDLLAYLMSKDANVRRANR
jgi:putative heme-binding domain-containing protein